MINNIKKQLIKQLDARFVSIEKQLDQVETKLENFRAFNERTQLELKNEITNLSQKLDQTGNFQAIELKAIELKEEVQDVGPPIEAIKELKPIPNEEKQTAKHLETINDGFDEAFSKEETLFRSEKKKIKKEALKEYLEKIERVTLKT